MKTAITVSVRDGWLTAVRQSGDRRKARATQTQYIVDVYDSPSRYEQTWGVHVVRHGQHHNDEWYIPEVRAAEVMELIHAGKGEIRREVGT